MSDIIIPQKADFSHSKDLLLVIDMQKVYLPGNPWACPSIERSAGNIIRLLESGKIPQVIFTEFSAPQSPVGVWKNYNTEYAAINEDPVMNELLDVLKPYTARYPLWSKSVYSSYAIAQLRELAAAADHVVLTGVVAECCVLATAMSAIDAGNRVIYLKDAVSGFSEQNEAETEHLLSCLSPLHTSILCTEEYLSQC